MEEAVVGRWQQPLWAAAGAGADQQSAREAELFEQIGRLKMALEWLKKKLTASVEEKRVLVEPTHPAISIRRQCALLGLSRASYYYQTAAEEALNLELMRRIDLQYMETPFYGWPKMTAALRRQGYPVNGKRVRRLMRQMGLQAITLWKVERLIAWLQNFRRVIVRYEYYPENYQGFVQLGCLVILLRQYL